VPERRLNDASTTHIVASWRDEREVRKDAGMMKGGVRCLHYTREENRKLQKEKTRTGLEFARAIIMAAETASCMKT
jgi:hypothetical protein